MQGDQSRKGQFVGHLEVESAEHKTESYRVPLQLQDLINGGCLFPLSADEFLLAFGYPQRSFTPPPQKFSLYAPDFFLEDPTPWWTFPNHQHLTKQEALRLVTQPTAAEQEHGERNTRQPIPRSTGQTDWPPTPSTKFQQSFQTIKSLIANNQINKAVLTTLVPIALASDASVSVVVEPSKITSSYDANPWLSALPQLLTATLNNAGPTRYPYALWTPHDGIIGATPEILFDLNAPTSTLKTMAMAGTRKASLENSAPLLFDPKERHEHKIVVDFLLQQLRQLDNIGSVYCSETYVLRTGELCHLRADIEVSTATSRASSIDEADWAEHTKFIKRLVELLHPTPALGTAPHKAFSLLKSLDNGEPRGRFGAPFGILTPDGSFRTLVAIRNLQWGSFKNTSDSGEPGVSAFIGVGCGIVENSRLEDEWCELTLKLQSICNLFSGESSAGIAVLPSIYEETT